MFKIFFSLTTLCCVTALASAQANITTLNTSVVTKTESFNATATYYVATNGADNPANGGVATPFQTVRYALETLISSHPEGGFELVVKNGNYGALGYINAVEFANPVLVKAETPYQVHVKSATGHRALYVNKSKNIIFSGFEFTGKDRPWTNPTSIASNYYVLQIDDSKNIILENNLIHDSFNNDLLKLNEHSDSCEVRSNIFYNQDNNPDINGGASQHIDANSVYHTIIEGNIFFNEYTVSGRENANRSSSFVLFKSSSTTLETVQYASYDAIIRKNVFLNWWGKSDQGYIQLGEDGKPFYEISNVEISDNLFINNQTRSIANGDGNLYNRMAGTMAIKCAKNVRIENNISTGFIQHSWHAFNDTHNGFFGYLLRISREGESPVIDGITITGNSLVDYSKQMGYISAGTKAMAINTTIDANNFFNGGKTFLNTPIEDLAIQIKDDIHATFDDPRLEADLTNVATPYFDGSKINGDYATINDARLDLILKYGTAKPVVNGDDVAPTWIYTTNLQWEWSKTNQNVDVTLTVSEEIKPISGWKKMNDLTYTKTYTENMYDNFIIEDLAGNQAIVNVRISGIDRTPPTATLTCQDDITSVTATITANEDIQAITDWVKSTNKIYIKIYTANVKEEVEIKDVAGNKNTVQVEITTLGDVGIINPIIDDKRLKEGEKVEVYNLNGSLVRIYKALQGDILESALENSALPTGIYIVKAGNKTAKVVKK